MDVKLDLKSVTLQGSKKRLNVNPEISLTGITYTTQNNKLQDIRTNRTRQDSTTNEKTQDCTNIELIKLTG